MNTPLTPAPISPVQDIVAELAAGRIVILVDEEDRENEGDLVIAADHVTPEAINFMARFGRGLICLTLTRERCERLQLPPMATRNGTCRTCICLLTEGQVRYEMEWPGLSPEEKAEGWVLPCVARPLGDVTLEIPAV